MFYIMHDKVSRSGFDWVANQIYLTLQYDDAKNTKAIKAMIKSTVILDEHKRLGGRCHWT